ncbi:transcription regulator HTH, apses-type DNA-binding domain-containing protein, partial [Trichophaea hybrida]
MACTKTPGQAVYSGVPVFEMTVNNVAVMRRRDDSWLNATQILKVAGVEKGKRTKVLEKEILSGKHEKVQGGYGKYQGTWIDFQRGRDFCRAYGVEDLLAPLLNL